MKGNARKVMALVMALAMLLSVFATAENIGQEIDLGGEIVIEGGLEGETQGEGGEQDLELGEGVDAPDGEPELALGEDLDLDLNDLSLDSLEGEALPPETGLAMNAGETWTDWTNDDSLPDTAGNYKIEGIVTLSSNWSVPKTGETKLWLTVNGKINLGDNWINVADGAKLEIVSESTGTIESNSMFGTAISVGANGTFKMHGGKINGNGTPMSGGGVVSIPSGAFTMTGGTIEATAESGIAVSNSNDFTMTGGTISAHGLNGTAVANSGSFNMHGDAVINAISRGVNNQSSDAVFSMFGGTINAIGNTESRVYGTGVTSMGAFTISGGTINATGEGGTGVNLYGGSASFEMSGGATINAGYVGVYNNGQFGGQTVTMSGGQIIGQRAEGSKGVDSSGGTFKMTGGEISNFDTGVSINGTNFTMNKTGSDSSGTISRNNIGVNVNGTFNMNAGKIQNNTIYGVYYSSGTFNMSGGSITGNSQYGVYLYAATGKIRLSGQVDISRNTPADIYLYINGSNPGNIIIEDGFACDKPISVDGDATEGYVFTSGFSKTGSSDPAKYFKSGVEGYGLYLKDNEVAFGQTATVTFNKNSDAATGTMDPQAVVKGVETELNECAFTWRGHSFDGWNTKADGSGTKYADKAKVTLSADTTLYAVWKQNGVMIDIPAAQEYTGKAIEPKLKMKDTSTGEPLVEGTDYTVRYSDNVKATKDAKAVVTFKGGYASWGTALVKFAINPKPITVIAEDKTKVEGEADPVLTYISDDLADGDKLEGALAREAGEKPGTYKITQGDLNNKNYKITFVGATLTITEKKVDPTTTPTTTPTTKPTTKPTTTPTAKPTATPTAKPTEKPVEAEPLLLARMTVSGTSKTALRVKWNSIKGADGYDVYFAKCGRSYKSKPKATVSGCSVKVSRLDARECYKAYVRAWVKVGGKKVYIVDSPEVHAITGGYDAKYCNAKSVKLNRSQLSLKVGRSATLKATVKGVKSGRKVLKHVRTVRFYSSNADVATVNKNGKVRAVGKGVCTIYAVANNGIRSSVKVTVK